MKSQKRGLWAACIVGVTIALPPIIFAAFSIEPKEALWLLTAFPWVTLQSTSVMAVLGWFVTQLGAACLFNWQLTRQLQKAGESSSKALLSGEIA